MSKLYEKLTSVTLPDGSDTAVWGQWLNQTAANNGIESSEMTLLLHADDGVIWGLLVGNTLALSSEAFSEVAVSLRAKTVQQLRFFGEAGELLVWRTGTAFEGRVVTAAVDTAVGTENCHEEAYLLWGENIKEQDGFTLLQEGARGLLHAPPGSGQSAFINVRHYIEYDPAGQAYVALSRIVSLNWANRPSENTEVQNETSA